MANNDEIRDLLEQLKQKNQTRNEQGQFSKKSVMDVVKEIGLSTDDMRVQELLSREETIEDAEKAVYRLAMDIHYKRPSAADLPSQVAKRAPILQGQEALMEEYRQGSKNLYGDALMQYKQKMREKGLRIS